MLCCNTPKWQLSAFAGAEGGQVLTAVVAALRRQFGDARIARMRSAMLEAASWLDYSARGRLAEAVLAHFDSVASGRVAAVPPTTHTPLPVLNLKL